MKKRVASITVALVALGLAPAAGADDIRIGHMADYSGPTSDVGVPYGHGVADALAWVNSQGGVAGTALDVETIDYGYKAPRAIGQYQRWTSRNSVVAIEGWGTADTEALITFVARDEIPYVSASYSAALTDPKGQGPRSHHGSPYNFFYGPSYSDAVRALLQWAHQDWTARGGDGRPGFVHMGANHPYPNAPKAAGEEYAAELGFDVTPSIQFALTPGDYTAQCLTLKNSGADYAYLANTAGSNISLLRACETVGVDVQFMSNVWGMDGNAMKAAGVAADGVVFPVRTASVWGDDVPGMATVRAISAVSDPSGTAYRPVHYLAGVCSAMLLVDGLTAAAAAGEVSGPAIRSAIYGLGTFAPGALEGVCAPVTFTPDDHRGLVDIPIYRSRVAGPTDAGSVDELIAGGTMGLDRVGVISLERKAEWLGW